MREKEYILPFDIFCISFFNLFINLSRLKEFVGVCKLKLLSVEEEIVDNIDVSFEFAELLDEASKMFNFVSNF